MKQKLIDKIIENTQSEELVELLNLDVYEVIEQAAIKLLNAMDDDSLLELL